MDKLKTREAALQWMEAWNQKNIAKVMEHYAEDVEFYSPTVIDRWKEEKGKLIGKAALERHFRKGMEDVPGINFRFRTILFGVDSIILLYERETGKLAADWVSFDGTGKVKEVRSYYEYEEPVGPVSSGNRRSL